MKRNMKKMVSAITMTAMAASVFAMPAAADETKEGSSKMCIRDRWETDSSKDGVNVQLYPEFEDPFPAPPVNAVRVEGVKNFTFRISQKKKNLAPGRYVLKAQYAGTDTTGVEVHLFAEKTNDVNTQNSELFQAVIHPTKEWQEAEIHFSIEEGYTLTAGLTISAPPVYGMVRRFLLYKEEIADGAKTLA